MADRSGAQPRGDESGPGAEPDVSGDPFLLVLDAARAGDREAMGHAMEPFRQFLRIVAERELAQDLKAKEAASDLVQDTMLEAHRHFGQFEGRSKQEMGAWLRRLLLHRVSYTIRRYRQAGKRRLGRERSIGATGSSPGLADWLAGDSTSPSARAARNEEEAAILAALDRLPEWMRQIVIWREREDCSFDEIGRRLGLSDVAARKRWLRALQNLRRELNVAPDRPEDRP